MRQIAIFLMLFFLLSAPHVFAQEFFWADPSPLLDRNVRFPEVVTGGDNLAVIYQEFTRQTEELGTVSISLYARGESGQWYQNRQFLGPLEFTGREAKIFTAAMDKNGVLYVALSHTGKEITVYNSLDGGRSFNTLGRVDSESTVVSPRLNITSQGELLLFITQEYQPGGQGVISSAIFYSYSSNQGKQWSSFSVLAPEPELSQNFLPHHTSFQGKEYVAFQVLDFTERPANFQLYMKISSDGGRTWGNPIPLTDFKDLNAPADTSSKAYDNQRPYLASLNGSLGMVWERRLRRNNPLVYFARISPEGSLLGTPERIVSGQMTCNNPKILQFKDRPIIFWFDNRAGTDHVILAVREGAFWTISDLSREVPGSSISVNPVAYRDDLFIFWENQTRGISRLMFLETDKTVAPPVLRGINFAANERYGRDSFSVGWTEPEDSSGILGFSYLYSQNPEVEPEKQLMVLRENREANFRAEEDGYWYFSVRAQDYAGNWSEPARIRVYRDTTPPGKVVFDDLEKDEQGFLLSNTVSLTWQPPEEEDLAGYSYRLQWLGGPERSPDLPVAIRPPSGTILTREGRLSLFNSDNGLWALTVSAVDTVGNVGEPEQILFRLNKYIPVTRISSIRFEQDELGIVQIRIQGRGYTAEGEITEIILDDNGRPPYLYSFSLESGTYRVLSDTLIQGPRIEEIEEGTYRLGLVHSKRGVYFANQTLALEASGTVKFGDFTVIPSGTWKTVERARYFFPFNDLILAVLMVLLGFMALFFVFRILSLAQEGAEVNRQVVALMTGGSLSPEERKERMYEMRKKGMGLRVKFVFLVTSLVICVVLLVSIPLSSYMINNQQQNLAKGLKSQSEVLLESLASGARAYLPLQRTLELRLLPTQRSAMTDSLYVTITGEGLQDSKRFDYVWASDDPALLEKIDNDRLVPGISYLSDEISLEIEALAQSINQEADQAVSALVAEMERLSSQTRPLAERLIVREDEATRQALRALQDEIQSLELELNRRLGEVGSVVKTIPEFNVEDFNISTTAYMFYKPIVFRSTQKGVYYNGLVRLGVSTESIIREIQTAREGLLIRTTIIAALALGIGIIGALILATIIIIPIKSLIKGVEKIRDTEDKEELSSHIINLKTKDELAGLAETVNQMTQGLVQAAKASKELTIGKEVQKMFIPLDKDATGRTLSTGRQDTPGAEFFGYYEGAKGVSGDYFDYKKLDEAGEYYAIMKCDVAGKGVSASLIMVEVATLFINAFRSWNIKTQGIHLDTLVYNINDMLEERGFKGRFAAFTAAILNTKTGVLHLCNAGDKLVHIYRAREKGMVVKELPQAPAAGVFPSDLVMLKGGFTQVKEKLEKGDTLFLFTDGIEEAKRNFRDRSFKPIVCDEPGIPENGLHDTHQKGAGNEEFGIPRLEKLVDSVFNKGIFNLDKYHNPVPGEELTFDFTQSQGTAEEAVLAMVAVEKVFRLYPDPKATAEDRITVDSKVDSFLKKHFQQYKNYFRDPKINEKQPEYLQFPYLKEDEQYDDLTILAIKKK